MNNDVLDVLELPAIWYHGTHHFRTEGITQNGIDLSKSRPFLDFGPGFYLTSNYEQAQKQAVRVTKDHNKEQNKNFIDNGEPAELTFGTVLIYELDNTFLKQHAIGQIFEVTDEDWARFILGNRSLKAKKLNYTFHNRDGRYEYVYGPLADGLRIPRLIRELEKNRISEQTFFEQISSVFQFPYNNQLSLHTLKSISSLNLKEVQAVDTRKPLNT